MVPGILEWLTRLQMRMWHVERWDDAIVQRADVGRVTKQHQCVDVVRCNLRPDIGEFRAGSTRSHGKNGSSRVIKMRFVTVLSQSLMWDRVTHSLYSATGAPKTPNGGPELGESETAVGRIEKAPQLATADRLVSSNLNFEPRHLRPTIEPTNCPQNQREGSTSENRHGIVVSNLNLLCLCRCLVYSDIVSWYTLSKVPASSWLKTAMNSAPSPGVR